MIIIDKIKKMLIKEKPRVFTQLIQSETVSPSEVSGNYSSNQSTAPELGTSTVPAFDIEELSYVLECQSRRYSRDLSV